MGNMSVSCNLQESETCVRSMGWQRSRVVSVTFCFDISCGVCFAIRVHEKHQTCTPKTTLIFVSIRLHLRLLTGWTCRLKDRCNSISMCKNFNMAFVWAARTSKLEVVVDERLGAFIYYVEHDAMPHDTCHRLRTIKNFLGTCSLG